LVGVAATIERDSANPVPKVNQQCAEIRWPRAFMLARSTGG